MASDEDDSHLPTVSGPGPKGEREAPQAVPQIEGYEVVGRLGQGGMGVVWRAVQLSTRREVALKLLAAGAFASDKARARFEREVELAARLEHPNIARVYDSGLHYGAHYYVMELVAGPHLNEYVRKHALNHQHILELMHTVCCAVEHAHQRGVVHRDLKPSNILMAADGQPRVLDFGLAKGLLETDRDLAVSASSNVLGTVAYMSPEQAAGHQKQVGTQSDVYSLGVILFCLLTGEPPHDLSGTWYEVLERIAKDEVRRPREVCAGIDRDLEAVLLKALARAPEGRYATAEGLAGDIHNYLEGRPLAAKAPSAIRPATLTTPAHAFS